ncbi:MAG: hypothetical protein AAB426_12305 [Myxococcota bacterium]
MRAHQALSDVVKPQLEESFGAGLTARILFSARDVSAAPVVGLNRTHYSALVDAIAKDQRVTQMWGDFGTKTRLKSWHEACTED